MRKIKRIKQVKKKIIIAVLIALLGLLLPPGKSQAVVSCDDPFADAKSLFNDNQEYQEVNFTNICVVTQGNKLIHRFVYSNKNLKNIKYQLEYNLTDEYPGTDEEIVKYHFVKGVINLWPLASHGIEFQRQENLLRKKEESYKNYKMNPYGYFLAIKENKLLAIYYREQKEDEYTQDASGKNKKYWEYLEAQKDHPTKNNLGLYIQWVNRGGFAIGAGGGSNTGLDKEFYQKWFQGADMSIVFYDMAKSGDVHKNKPPRVGSDVDNDGLAKQDYLLPNDTLNRPALKFELKHVLRSRGAGTDNDNYFYFQVIEPAQYSNLWLRVSHEHRGAEFVLANDVSDFDDDIEVHGGTDVDKHSMAVVLFNKLFNTGQVDLRTITKYPNIAEPPYANPNNANDDGTKPDLSFINIDPGSWLEKWGVTSNERTLTGLGDDDDACVKSFGEGGTIKKMIFRALCGMMDAIVSVAGQLAAMTIVLLQKSLGII